MSSRTARAAARNALKEVYGRVPISRAMTVSSDVYFYNVGAQFWFKRATVGELRDPGHGPGASA